MKRLLGWIAALTCALLLAPLGAWAKDAKISKPQLEFGEALQWREVGPFRGGRSAAITGVADNPLLYYFGATGGGVWKTTDAGVSWQNISDGFFGGSIGAVAVAASDANVIYVGTGESTVRGNTSQGDGMWKSTDAGRSWQFAGLPDSRTITRVLIDPRNPDVVFAAVLGDIFAASTERGVYKTVDGGKNWRRVLYTNDRAGADDLVMDPSNPRILYAATWRVTRGPYALSSGGAGSGLWKSTDSGETWTELSANDGLPKYTDATPWGISSIAVSASNPDNLYAMVEHQDGGLFRSRDAGKTWKRVSEDRALRQRAWYFSRIAADPNDAETVWVLNVRLHRSKDGGKNFVQVPTPHPDHHDHWIDPNNSDRIASANDGGATISNDGGVTWSTQGNQPTAQLYRVAVDDAFPYRLLAGQQDNSALRIRSRSLSSSSIGERDWQPTAGGESGWISAKPGQPDVVFGGSYMGFLMKFDHATDAKQIVNVWPEETIGHAAADAKYRFQWNFPLLHSQHQKNRLFAAGNRLFASDDDGHSWTPISPDLTRANPDTLGASGGPITKDNTGVEYYATIFAFTESRVDAKLLWAGSDDGLIHRSDDAGSNWVNVTPKSAASDMMWNSLEASPFDANTVYAVGTRYKLGDRKPYIYQSEDRGRSWRLIVTGIDSAHFTRALAVDDRRAGLLYAGTERGMYISENDGASWRSLQLNLPIVPITDLALHQGDLIAATQGRSFWILDDVSPLQLGVSKDTGFKLFAPRASYRLDTNANAAPKAAGRNPAPGSWLYFNLPKAASPSDQLSLELGPVGQAPIIRFTRKPEPEEIKDEKPKPEQDLRLLPSAAGLNRFAWDQRYPAPKKFAGLVAWNGDLSGPFVTPGRYVAKLTFAGQSESVEFEIKADPRVAVSEADFLAQRDAALGVSNKLSALHERIGKLMQLQEKLKALAPRIKSNADLKTQADALSKSSTALLESVYQTKLKSEQDPLNFPVKLNDKLAALLQQISFGDAKPTKQQLELRTLLFTQADQAIASTDSLIAKDVAALNTALRAQQLNLLELSEVPE